MKDLLSHQTSAYSSSNTPHPLTAKQGPTRAKPALKNRSLVSFLPCSGVHTGWTMMLTTSLCLPSSSVVHLHCQHCSSEAGNLNLTEVSSTNKNERHFIRISSAAFQNKSLGLSSSWGVGFTAIFTSTGFFQHQGTADRSCRALLRNAATKWLAKLY